VILKLYQGGKMMKMQICNLFLLVFILSIMASPALAAEPAGAWEEIQALMAQEDFAGAAARTEQALKDSPDNADLWVKLSEVMWYRHDRLPEKAKEQRIDALKTGLEAGRNALEINEKSAGGHYWTAAAIASLGKEQGIMKNLFRLTEMRSHIKRVEEIDPKYYYGAVYRYWAIVCIELPKLARKITGMDMEKGYNYIQQSIAAEPRFLKNYYLLAEWHIENKDKPKARQVLKEITERDPEALPEMAWENRHFHKKAQEMLETL
jgi:tetratricopeptide (TPR) repeat protein